MRLVRNGFKAILVCALLLVYLGLLGCFTSVKSVPSNQPSSVQIPRDTIKDSGPAVDMDVAHIPDAVPRHEIITAAGNKTPYRVLGKTYFINFDTAGFVEEGYGSWYGKKFHGRKTSNGEVYDMYGMTAAHKTLPIPTFVKVTNLENGKTAIVRVNDRGPFHSDRIIDLSYTAAKKLGYQRKGTAKVRVEAIDPLQYTPSQVVADAAQSPQGLGTGIKAPMPRNSAGYTLPNNTYLQVGAFSQRAGANRLIAQMNGLVRQPITVDTQTGSQAAANLHKVLIGPIFDNIELAMLRRLLEQNSLPRGHIVEKP